jgi:predicted MFS family arabinose efflux permease
LAAVQFLSFLDFELLMPVGAYIGPDLGINASQLGELVSVYTLAGMVGSLLYARVADRWERRTVLCWLMTGLALGTLACSLAQNYPQLLAARILAGISAGPAGATVLAMVSDVVPESRRGRGIGVVMGGFTVSSVLGMPISVYLAELAGWRRPFLGLACVAAAVIVFARIKLPPGRPEAQQAPVGAPVLPSLFAQPKVRLAWLAMATLMIADFAFVPYLASYLVQNLLLPKSQLGLVYGAAGLTTLITFQFAGRLTDRYGAFKVGSLSSLAVMIVIGVFFLLIPAPAGLGLAMAGMIALYLFNAPRVLSAMTLFTKVPAAEQRGEFMAIQNVVQQGAVGLGSFLAARLIAGEPGGRIEHIPYLVMQNWTFVLLGLYLVWRLEKQSH